MILTVVLNGSTIIRLSYEYTNILASGFLLLFSIPISFCNIQGADMVDVWGGLQE